MIPANTTKKISSFLLLPLLFFLFVSAKPTIEVDKKEAQEAFEYLNRVRLSPADFSKEIGVNLRKVKPLPALVWNDTLAAVAEARAKDMAEKNYFGHINKKGEGVNILIHRAGYHLSEEFYKNKKNNFFESLAMGQESGVEVVRDLILDKGINPPDHRKHLLGMNDFWAECYDVGIGFIRTDNPQKPSYICIIIAKHEKRLP